MPDKLLSIRQARFVREFLKDGNATQAYIRAGYSRHSAQQCSSRLLTQPHIAAATTVYRQRLAQALEADVEACIRAGITVQKARNHRKQQQSGRLTPGRQKPGLTAQDRERYEERCAAYELALNHRKEQQRWLEWELNETRATLAEAQATIDAAGLAAAPGPTETLRPTENHSNRR
jgi:phage terminase small subunit